MQNLFSATKNFRKFFEKFRKISKIFENFSSPEKYFAFHTVTLLLINRLLIFWVFFDVDLSRGGAESG